MTLHAPQTMARNAARILVDQLIAQRVRHVFCVPGESYLPVLDALYDSGIQVIAARNEGGAAMMAEAHGKATGRPGICFVTRGPGAANAVAGVHIASQDSTPLILFVGQVERKNKGRDSFQEMDYPAVFGSLTKWAAEIGQAGQMAEYVSRAFATAMSGRPGPVVLSLPRDMLLEQAPIENNRNDVTFIEALETAPSAEQIAALAAMIGRAKRPMLLLGGGRWDAASRAAITRFAERFALPVMTSYRRAPLFDAGHPNYAGDLGLGPNPKLLARVKASDLVIAAGARLNEITAQGYTLFDPARLVHVYPGAEELGRVYHPALAIHASPRAFAQCLEGLTPAASPVWAAESEAAHQDYLDWSGVALPQPGQVNLSQIMIWLSENLGPDTILCNGAGNYASWIHRFYRFRRAGTHVAPISASMGYGIPAAVGMKALYPGREVISINGDGDFLMNGQDFATAVQYKLPFVGMVFDNSLYGTIRMHQQREYPGRVIATELVNPDFAAYARAFGGFGATVVKTEDFAPAFEAARASGLPSLLHVKYDSEGITPTARLSQLGGKP